jgi:proline iminopeptidase
MLPVGDGHVLYYEQSGNPSGQPLLFLHGGPGTGSSPDQRRLFDPEQFRIVQYDQRGCGRSTPHGSLDANMTAHLVEDIDKLLNRLEIDRPHIAGGSWGSTLALAFAMSHPQRVKSLLLYGIFLCRPCEFRSLYFKGGSVSQIYPEIFDPFIELMPPYDRDDPIKGYWKLFHSDDKQLRTKALYMWTLLEQQASRLTVDQQRVQDEMANLDYVLSHSLIENHYFQNDGFIDGDQILVDAGHRLAGLPVHIINGRYDLVCPLITAYQLHKALPDSTLTIVPEAGHSFREPGITDAIIRAGTDLLGAS